MIKSALATVEDRQKFINALQNITHDKIGKYNKIENENNDPKDIILEVLEETVKEIDFNNDNILFNRMQLTALLALEAEFFKFISKQLDENKNTNTKIESEYKTLYLKLFGSSSAFVSKYKAYSKASKPKGGNASKDHQPVNDNFVIDYKDVNSAFIENYFDDPNAFEHKLKFVKGIKPFLPKNAKTDTEPNLLNTNADSIKSFLLDIDPHLMSYMVVLNNNNFTITYSSNWTDWGADILHEIIASISVMFLTLVDVTMLAIPPAAVAALAVTYGATLPMTVGAAICVLSLELSHPEIKDNFRIRSMFNTLCDNALVSGKIDISTQQIMPFQIFDIPKLIYQLSMYTLESHQTHQNSYMAKSKDQGEESLLKLIQNKFKNQNKVSKRPPPRKKLSSIDNKMITRHLKDMGYKIAKAGQSKG